MAKGLFARIKRLFKRDPYPPIKWPDKPVTPPVRPTQKNVPQDLHQAINALVVILSDKEKAKIRFRGTGDLHFTFGRHIRNDWKLWDRQSPLHRWFVEQGIGHADDMSGIILTTLERTLQDKPIKLTEQIQYYRDYWLNIGVDPVTQESRTPICKKP